MIHIDLGKKSELNECCPVSEKPEKVYYPSLHLDGVDIPDLPDGKFTITAEVECVAYDKRHDSHTLEVKSIDLPYADKKSGSVEDGFEQGIAVVIAKKAED